MKTKIKSARVKAEKARLQKLGLSNLYPKVHLTANDVIEVSFGGPADWAKVKPEFQVSQNPGILYPPKSHRLGC